MVCRVANHSVILVCVPFLMACGGEGCRPQQPPRASESRTAQSVVVFEGMCDASAAVTLSSSTFAVANDEDNVLRVYDALRGGPPLSSVDLASALAQHATTSADPKLASKRPGEADLEAAAVIDGVAYWISSHGRSASGKLRPERQTFLATSAPADGGLLSPIGTVYHRLLADLIAEPRHVAFGFEAASQRAPKEPGGLNIEAMAPRGEGGVWVGFRGPLPEHKAILVALSNPKQVIEGASASFGDPALLDLGGLGVRALLQWRQGGYLIIAGSQGAGGEFKLFSWSAKRALRELPGVDFDGFSPEALLVVGPQGKLLALSDDGTRALGGSECKRLKDPSRRQFRGLWLAPQRDW
jgi:hypothetical protein